MKKDQIKQLRNYLINSTNENTNKTQFLRICSFDINRNLRIFVYHLTTEKMNIDLQRIKDALPSRAKVELIKYKGKSPAIEVRITPALSEEEFEECKQWQREIIGKENISEFYTEETGIHWYVFLKFNNKPITIEI